MPLISSLKLSASRQRTSTLPPYFLMAGRAIPEKFFELVLARDLYDSNDMTFGHYHPSINLIQSCCASLHADDFAIF
jgi:hypothetical protein